MDELIFSNQISKVSNLYIATVPNDYWCAFWLYDCLSSYPPEITFGKTVDYKGYYLFANKCPKDYACFFGKLKACIHDMKTEETGGIIWIADVDGLWDEGNAVLLQMRKYGTSFTQSVPFSYNIGNNFATLTISPMFKMSIELDKVNNRFLFSWPLGSNAISIRTNQTFHIISDDRLEIPLCGTVTGSIRFTGKSDGKSKCFSMLDTSLRFFYGDQEHTEDFHEVSYPVFQDIVYGDIPFQFSINPLDILNKVHLNTYFAFIGSDAKGVNGSITLLSNFRSDYGIPVNLIPEPDLSTCNGSERIPSEKSAVLVFSERKVGSKEHAWYTVPNGNFRISIAENDTKYLDASSQMRILCGLSGTETVSVSPVSTRSAGDFISFKAGQPAYVPQFPIIKVKNKVGENTSVKELNDSFHTAWVGFVKAPSSKAPVVYHLQPQGNAMFSDQQTDTSEESNIFLDFYPGNSGTLNDLAQTVYFPMAAYGIKTLMPKKVLATDFETQILIPMRKIESDRALKRQIESRAVLRNQYQSENRSLSLTNSVTSQGFCIQIQEETNTWEKMQLASNRFVKSDGTLSPIYSLEFQNLGATLQTAFQTEQLFLVVSSNVNDVLGIFVNEMQLEEWPFILDILKPVATRSNKGQYENVLIFKYCDGSLIDRVRNIQYWTSPEEFNDTSCNGLPNLSSWLSGYIEEGISKYEEQGDNDFYKFWNIATNPNWKGIIALKVNISLTTFPAELQGLLAGIDLENFYAHHFGIDASVVKAPKNAVEMSPSSSMFALINYEDTVFKQYGTRVDTYKENAPINTYVDYDFRVLLLKIVFSNSKIVNFNSYIAFTVNRLFGEKVMADNRGNLLILDGTYENQNGVPSYTFGVVGNNLMKLDSKIIQEVQVIKTGFVTSVSQNEKNGGKVESAFSFSGYISFYPLAGFDLFSFGNEMNISGNEQGLAFSNLKVSLDFPLSTPTEQTYAFDISKISLDLGASYIRKGSLYRHFPLQLTGIVWGTKNDIPTSRGFLNVELPSLQQQQATSDAWYGLVFKLDMGTLGALASNAGFNVQLIASWNIGGMGAAAYLKLPGVNPQAPALSLQGILRLNINTVQISIADDKVSYLLKLNNISLKFLSLSFPTKGQVGFFLFGNPAEKEAPSGSLGWYGGYKKK